MSMENESQTQDGESNSESAAMTAANEGSHDVQGTAADLSEAVSFKVVYKKTTHDVTFCLQQTAGELKDHLSKLTGVPVVMMKLMYKGAVKDDCKTLEELRVSKGAKMMVVGSTVTDVMEVATSVPGTDVKQREEAIGPAKEPLCKQRPHSQVIEKGKPDDALPAVKGKKEALPKVPLTGMSNKLGGKVRLTFKLEVDQLWIGTRERTQKVQMSSIHAVVSEPITGHEEYHMLAIQLGPTEQSRYWIYWVPAQFVDAIKDTVLGKWQYF